MSQPTATNSAFWTKERFGAYLKDNYGVAYNSPTDFDFYDFSYGMVVFGMSQDWIKNAQLGYSEIAGCLGSGEIYESFLDVKTQVILYQLYNSNQKLVKFTGEYGFEVYSVITKEEWHNRKSCLQKDPQLSFSKCQQILKYDYALNWKGSSKTIPPNLAPLDLEVYNIVSKIPQGKVSTYGTIARLAGKPKASRLIGRILSKNPYDTKIVPCHRVVRSDGNVSGYFGKSNSVAKAELLESEGISIAESSDHFKIENLKDVLYEFI